MKKRGARASWQSLCGKESCKRSWMAFWPERMLMEERLARLKSEAEKARLELEGLGRIEEKEAAAAPPG